MVKSKTNNMKDRFMKIIKSYKTIIYISFLINIILLFFTYYTMSSNKVYAFSGSDEYVEINEGLLVLNTDINLINGNNIKYVNSNDYDIKSYKIGYYVMDDKNLVDIVSTSLNFETEIKLSEAINNFTSLNVVEKNNTKVHFTRYNKSLLDDGIYFVIEAKTSNGDVIFDKVKLNMTKISKY